MREGLIERSLGRSEGLREEARIDERSECEARAWKAKWD